MAVTIDPPVVDVSERTARVTVTASSNEEIEPTGVRLFVYLNPAGPDPAIPEFRLHMVLISTKTFVSPAGQVQYLFHCDVPPLSAGRYRMAAHLCYQAFNETTRTDYDVP